MATFTDVLQVCVDNARSADEFLGELKKIGFPVVSPAIHSQLYEQVLDLARSGINGIWANIIRNSFAPLLQERVDFVVGNPPWVFWNTLPSPYREEIKQVMVDVYKLASGTESTMRRLGSAGKDISALFVYVALDRYLRDGGRLGFVITQTLFQSTAGNEFRQWKLPEGIPIRVSAVDDWVAVAPFASAANKTATFVAIRGEETTYPVKYRVWEATGRFDRDSSPLAEVRSRTSVRELWAHPSDPLRDGSLWIISESSGSLDYPTRIIPYRVRRGVETGLESAYRVRALSAASSGRILVENIRDRARRPLPALSAEVETSRIYPYITGASISRWLARSPGNYLVPHTRESGMTPLAESTMIRDYPLTYEFLSTFKQELEERPIHRKWGSANPFYALYNIGPYTFSEWKVVWKRTTRYFEAAVVSSLPVATGHDALAVPNGKVMAIAFEAAAEAYYVCAILNSSFSRARINSAISSEAHAEVLSLIHLPPFDPSNEIHEQLAERSVTCHSAASGGAEDKVARLETEVDELVAALWNLGRGELEAAQARVARTGRVRRRG